jgi:hypothetical protein
MKKGHQNKNIHRNRNDENLAGLYVVSHETAYHNGKLRKGVYGMVDRTTSFICTPADPEKSKSRVFVRDVVDLPKACKNRILSFLDDKSNKWKRQCYLVEKPLYLESKQSKK